MSTDARQSSLGIAQYCGIYYRRGSITTLLASCTSASVSQRWRDQACSIDVHVPTTRCRKHRTATLQQMQDSQHIKASLRHIGTAVAAAAGMLTSAAATVPRCHASSPTRDMTGQAVAITHCALRRQLELHGAALHEHVAAAWPRLQAPRKQCQQEGRKHRDAYCRQNCKCLHTSRTSRCAHWLQCTQEECIGTIHTMRFRALCRRPGQQAWAPCLAKLLARDAHVRDLARYPIYCSQYHAYIHCA
jgi:hypothetical protein